MSIYSRVIVPLDGSELSEQALPYAQRVASSMAAPIELLQACHILAPAVLDTSTRQLVELMLEGRRRRAEEYLSGVRDRLEAAGGAVSVATPRGEPGGAIVAHAGADPEALVVMSTHGRGGVGSWTLGSVTGKVLHALSNPLLVVRAAASDASPMEAREQTVLVPLDGSQRAELSLPHAIALAAALGARVSLLRVTPPAGYYREQLGAAQPAHGEAPRGASAEAQAESDAEAVTAYLSDVSRRLHGEGSREVAVDHVQALDVAQAIIDSASRQRSLVVMASHGFGGSGRSALGSVTDRVVRHSAAPVLVIR